MTIKIFGVMFSKISKSGQDDPLTDAGYRWMTTDRSGLNHHLSRQFPKVRMLWGRR